MAEETKKPVEEVVVPEAEKGGAPPVLQPDEAEKAVETTVKVEEKKIEQQVSFKEESNVVSELPEFQKKALDELKKLIQDALEKHEFSYPPPKKVDPIKVEEPSKTEDSTKIEGGQNTEETQKTEEPTKADEPTKTEEPTKVDEPLKTEEPSKTEEPKKVDEPLKEEPKKVESLKTEEPKKAEPLKTEEPKKDEPLKTEEPKKAEEPQKTEEPKKKEDEDIKETIVVEVAGAAATAPAPEEESSLPPPPPSAEAPKEPEQVTIWGIPLLLDERTDVILLKFLRARDFKVKEAFTMIRNTARWRKEYNVDSIIEEDLGDEYKRVVFTSGVDKHGRVVCYNVFGEFQNKELYDTTFSDGEKRSKFLRWLVQFLERVIRGLDFSPKGINSFVLVNDLKNSPGYGKREIYKVIDKFVGILQDNYPEFAAKQLCINVSWWYLAYNWIYLTVFTPRSKSKFVFASPSKTAETLFKYIAPEQVPVQFGGHSKIGEHEFSTGDAITEVTIKPGGKHPIEFSFSEETELVWELRVIGWDVTYGAEFLPAKEGGYTLNIAKPKKVAITDEPVICDTFKVTEPGKVVITIDNQSSKKKKLLYRSKVKASK